MAETEPVQKEAAPAQKERAYAVTVDGKEFSVKLNGMKDAARISVGEAEWMSADLFTQGLADQFSLLVDNRSYEGLVESTEEGLRVWVDGEPFEVAVIEQWLKALAGGRLAGGAAPGQSKMTSPMPGMVVGVAALPGDEVRKGQPLVTLEAMKMRNDLKSPRDGIIKLVAAAVGKTVAKGDLLMEFEE